MEKKNEKKALVDNSTKERVTDQIIKNWEAGLSSKRFSILIGRIEKVWKTNLEILSMYSLSRTSESSLVVVQSS